jgi:membrane protease YdiL (CAAX protease family)
LAAGLLISLYPSLKNWSSDQGAQWVQDSVIAQFVYILLAETFAIWLVFKLLRWARVKRQQIGMIRPRVKDIVYTLSGYGVYFVSYIIVIVIASHFSNLINIGQSQKIGFESASGTGPLILVFISLVVLPPIAEEIMFRGFLFSSLRQKFRFRYAVIITSVLFGIAHLQFGSGAPLLWVAAIDTFILSCVLCYLREKSNSLWPSILLHGLKNFIAYIALFHSKF